MESLVIAQWYMSNRLQQVTKGLYKIRSHFRNGRLLRKGKGPVPEIDETRNTYAFSSIFQENVKYMVHEEMQRVRTGNSSYYIAGERALYDDLNRVQC